MASLRAALQTSGRTFLGLEIDPGYVDVAVRRWQSFTGKQAVRASDGRTFDALQPNSSGQN